MNSLLLSVLLVACRLRLGKSQNYPTDGLLFVETFQTNVFEEGRWQKSGQPGYEEQPVEIKKCRLPGKGFENDTALELTTDMKKYAVGTKFPTVIDNTDKDLVLQYEVKYDDVVSCAGAYLKFLRQTDSLDIATLDNTTPYSIMFGPDKCGTTNKVHFIIDYQNPITKAFEEKHFNDAPPMKTDKKSHLYTLHIKKDNTFEIFIDMKSSKKGHLHKDMTPSFNPPSTIDDPTDVKPSDWDDRSQIEDPDAVKPDDWDEEQPAMIDDPDDKMPEGWLVDAPAHVPDPSAVKPADWDDEEDGEWEAPVVPNPDCEKVGCGEWKPRRIKNPLYKGKWHRPLINNPAYKGEWQPRQIPNPNYFEEEHPYKVQPIGGIGIEIWTMNPEIRFDNIVISHSLEAAFKFAEASFVPKADAESKVVDPKVAKREQWKKLQSDGTWAGHFRVVGQLLMDMFKDNIIAFTAIIGGVTILILYRLTTQKKDTEEINESNTSSAAKEENEVKKAVEVSQSSATEEETSKADATANDKQDGDNYDNGDADEDSGAGVKASSPRRRKARKA